MTVDRRERPNVIPWPPLILCVAALGAWALGHLLPLSLPMPWPLGAAIGIAGLGLDAAAMFTMHRHRANILPHRAATTLVTSGPFAYSRNPIYLGNTLLLIGAGFATNNVWFLIAAAAAAWFVTVLAIRREELHLSMLFGAEWDAYCHRVPRWIGF